MVTTIIPPRLMAKPARIISTILNRLDPYTMAFGGVATGSIKAQLAAKVIDAPNIIGSSPRPIAKAAITGKKTLVVAILDVNSVRKTINVTAANIRAISPNTPNGSKPFPSHAANPVEATAFARLKPPPKRIRRFQGTF